jgi:endoglucanase
MTSKELAHLAERLMRIPASPYHEIEVRAEAERICLEHGLPYERDRFGNLLVRLATHRSVPPLVLAAHLDHPGFEIMRSLGIRRWLARFLGGVPDDHFRAGLPLRLMPGSIPATLGRRVGERRQFEVRAWLSPAAPPQFAVWELEDFVRRDGCIHGRSCDDLIGVATVLGTLIELKRRRRRVSVIGVISRAEEVGFHGALTVAASRRLPKDALIISLETSRELPPVRMGQGVIIRVGDRTSIFDSTATRFLTEVAAGLQKRRASFQFQRALMSGGTCEATAYQEFGFRTAAVCVALGHYHNCAPGGRIAAEFVSLSDAVGMLHLLTECAHQMPSYTKVVERLPARLNASLRAARRSLVG